MDIGIDLGTTYSVIAINGNVKLADGYPAGTYLDQCDVTIIPTPEGELTFASAVWEDPEQPGKYIVGSEALAKADLGESPVLFSKRKIGTAEPIPLNGRTILARDAATIVLKHLKACAEQALGTQVRRAVVSHPAYFDRSQVEETRQAAINADLDVSLPEQMVMEPVAAALAYTRTDVRDPLNALIYDLGGGTFDVTYIQRQGGVLFARAFDGDHLLGGYNFDREIIAWLRRRIADKGRDWVLDESKPADRGRLGRLLRIAESIKIELAGVPSDDTRVAVRIPDLLLDAQGRKISVLENITRAEFVALIRPSLELTCQRCQAALKKGGGDADTIDEILLVGGSSYGPWVRAVIQSEFPGRSIQLFHPDLCVGAGAAIHAAMVLPTAVRAADDTLQMIVDVPANSVLPEIDVVGKLVAAGGTLPFGATIRLEVDGGFRSAPQPPGPNNSFHFGEISLQHQGPTSLCLTVLGATGNTLLQHRFEVRYAPDATDTTTISTVLPKPLFIETIDGLVPLANEGAALPASCTQSFIRDNDNSNISIRIYQEDLPIGTIRVEDIPRAGGKNARVALEVKVTEKNQVLGSVRIISPTGKLVKESEVRATFDVPEIPDAEALVEEFEKLVAAGARIVAEDDDTELVGRVETVGAQLIEKTQHQLNQQPLERAEVHAALRELRRIVQPAADKLSPSRKIFVKRLAACAKTLEEIEAEGGDGSSPDRPNSRRQRAQRFRQMLPRLEADGLAAHGRSDAKTWGAINDTLERITSQLDNSAPLDAPAVVLKIFAAMRADHVLTQLDSQERRLKERGLLGDWGTEVNAIRQRVQKLCESISNVDDQQDREQVRAQLAVLLSQQLDPLSQRISNLGMDLRRS